MFKNVEFFGSPGKERETSEICSELGAATNCPRKHKDQIFAKT